jgi:hypothetical protein
MQQPINNNKQQTAVEWFAEQIESGKIEIVYSDKIHSIKCIPEIIQQAKELEKEQIIEAFKHGEFWILQTIAEAVNNTTTKPLIPKNHEKRTFNYKRARGR